MESTADYGVAVFRQFIKNMQPQLLKSKQKKHITDFYKYFFTHFPNVPLSSIEFLFLGNEEKNLKGLLASCGNTNVKTMHSVKMSSVLALELVSKLIDPDTNRFADHYLDCLINVSSKVLESMKLDRHVLCEYGVKKQEIACKLVHDLVSTPECKYTYHDCLNSDESIRRYEEWLEENVDVSSESEVEPERWSDITLQDFEAELAAQQDEQQWSEETSHVTVDPLGLRKEGFVEVDIKKKTRGKTKQLSSSVVVDTKVELSDDEGVSELSTGLTHEGSMNTGDANFNPILFLHNVHRDTSLADLEKGLETLRLTTNSRANQMRQLVKDHFNEFVYCKDTIDQIHELIQHEVVHNIPGSKTGKLSTILTGLETKSVDLYSDILTRERQSTRIRRLLTVMHRFPLLFKLSGRIKKNIADGEYAKVVRDYKKFKSFEAVPSAEGERKTIPEKVLEHVASLLEGVRRDLLKKLENPRARMEDQQRIIGFLLELDCPEDPTWYYLLRQRDWIMRTLERCYQEHMERLKHFGHGVDNDNNVAVDHSVTNLIKKLSLALVHSMPNFVSLAGDIASGKFTRGATENSLSSFSNYATRAKDVQVTDTQRVFELIGTVLEGYCGFVRSVIFPRYSEYYAMLDVELQQRIAHPNLKGSPPRLSITSLMQARHKNEQKLADEKDKGTQQRGFVPLPPSLLKNVNTILLCYQAISRLQGFPSLYLKAFDKLSDDLIKYTSNRLFLNAFSNISKLSFKEKWTIDVKHPGVTLLPNVLEETLLGLLEDLDCIPRQRLKNAKVVSAIAGRFFECLRAFADCLHFLGTEASALYPTQASITSLNTFSALSSHMDQHSSSISHKLLLVLSNIVYSSDSVIPDMWDMLLDRFPRAFEEELDDGYQDVLDVYESIESLFFKRFTRLKVVELNKTIKHGFFEAGVTWSDCPPARDISRYMLDVLLQLVFLHDQVNSVLPSQLTRILQTIVHGIVVQFKICLSSLDDLCPHGALQLAVEIAFLKESMGPYVDHDSEVVIEKIEQMLAITQSTWSTVDRKLAVKRSRKIMHDTRKSTATLFVCFQNAVNISQE